MCCSGFHNINNVWFLKLSFMLQIGACESLFVFGCISKRAAWDTMPEQKPMSHAAHVSTESVTTASGPPCVHARTTAIGPSISKHKNVAKPSQTQSASRHPFRQRIRCAGNVLLSLRDVRFLLLALLLRHLDRRCRLFERVVHLLTVLLDHLDALLSVYQFLLRGLHGL